MSRRTRLAGFIAAVLFVTGAAVLELRSAPASCGSSVTRVPAGRSSSPFLDAAGRREQPDAERDRAVTSLEAARAPFGPVLGAVGYDYGQWAQLSAYAGGLGVRTRDNPDFTMLDEQTLRPRWSVQVATKRSAYDADGRRYLVATMPASGSPDLVALDLRTGRRLWCAPLGGPAVGRDDPFATGLDEGGGVTVVGPGTGSMERLASFDGRGERRWTREIEADRGDYLGALGPYLLVGGRAEFELADANALAERTAGTALLAVSPSSGRTAWAVPEPAGGGAHVVGVDGDVAVLQEVRAGRGRLRAIDSEGRPLWSVPLRVTFEAALRAGRVLVRSGPRWSAYAAATGRPLWTRTFPDRPQLLPYGFSLDQVPLLDGDHALIGTTTALRVLDLSTGTWGASAALPTDGINTTYWPYQVVVTDRLIAVATNTSAVVLRRGADGADG